MPDTLPDLRLSYIPIAMMHHQGFITAQQELSLSTSAISTYVSQLENQLGIVLCHRGRGGFSLTSKGELFYQKTLHIFGELEGFGYYALALKGELHGTLNLGVPNSTVSDPALPLTEVVGAFSCERPVVHLYPLVQSLYELQLSILENRQDLVIGAFSSRMNGLVYQPLYREQHWLYCSDRHPLFDERRISTDLVIQQHMVGCGYWSRAKLARHDFRHSAGTIESMETQLILILSGGYIGYLPEHYVRPWVEQGRPHALLSAILSYQAPFSLILRRGRSHESPIQAFRDQLQTQMSLA